LRGLRSHMQGVSDNAFRDYRVRLSSRIGALEAVVLGVLGWFRARFLYQFPQSSFEELGEPGFGFKGFQGVV